MQCSLRVNIGPLSFSMYVNDMSGAFANKLRLYSDDSAKLVADKNISVIETLLQKKFEVISDWISSRYTWVRLSRYFCF